MKYIFLLFSLTCFAQQSSKTDFISLDALVKPNAIEKTVKGEVSYVFKVKELVDTIKIDAVRMEFSDVKINGKPVNFKNSGKTLALYEGYKKGKNTLTFSYSAQPRQTMYFVGDVSFGNNQIWTQGQGKYTSHWLPSFDDVNEKLVFNLSVEYRNDYEIISNGVLKDISYNSKGNLKTYRFQMQKPMSSYLVMLAISKYDKYEKKSESGVPLEMYLKRSDASKFESTYKYSKDIFDFLEKEIGIKYPWQVYKQAPADDFLYAGMENTSATLFSQDFVVDETGYNDTNYINVNAHELAHHWFGDLITAKESKHHWLQEGFATYYALLAEKKLFGENYFNFELLKYAEELQNANKVDSVQVMNAKASSLSFYRKGAWALHYLRENIGAENFNKVVKNYLKKYRFKNVETEDFLAEIRKVTDYDTEKFQRIWLESTQFNKDLALSILSKNKIMNTYFELQKMENMPLPLKQNNFVSILHSDAYYPLKQEVLYQLAKEPYEEKKMFLQLALQSNNVMVRQALAETLKEIPADFKAEYESLLNDNSYRTREIVLQKLWTKFPEERNRYLDLSKEWVGNNDKNLRIIWLTLALGTKEYEKENKRAMYLELLDYASTQFDGSVRQNALEILLQINPSDEKVLISLLNATTHHRWQFVKFAKDNIRKLIKKPEFKKQLEELLPKLPEREQNFLKNELK
ncbi:M1 family metallopeptidase [Flavobacterium amniphilum]|uniref:M1 family metallopeptidase n=1 Tax=Flavobacterium amniphilum TaxID=1834035 RepID=UPI002029FE0F|nr:M1 family metallopeptidase [Flavobacterium amniphilum]MCL9805255.1 M1 family metallopeptidase [Flavobacterium amniphilum]